MWFLIILVVILLSAEGEMTPCNAPVEYTCKTPNPSPDFFVPGNGMELRSYCSTTKEFLECLHSYDLTCAGRSPFKGLYPPMYYHRIKSVLDKICDVRSSQYDTLIMNLPCIKQRITAMDDICSRTKSKVQKAYNEYLNENPNKNIKSSFLRNKRNQCLSFVATTACLIDNIEEECGFFASGVSSEIILETQILAEKCEVDIFLELKEAVPEFELDRRIKGGLEKYFVVEIL